MRWLIVIAVVTVAVLGTYWWATGGRRARGDDVDLGWLTGATPAHRGLHGPGAPENSLAAFEAAASAGLPIELDVHASSDRIPVVIHDDTLERMTGDPRAVSAVPASEITALTLNGTSETVPSLREVLDLVDGRVPLLIEIKNRGKVGALEDAVRGELADFDGTAAVMSFNPYVLARFARIDPSIPRGQLSSTFEGEDLFFVEKFVLGHLLMNWKSKPDFIAYDLAALPSWETSLQQRRGRPLLAWTAETPDDLVRADQIADSVICDPGALPR